MVSDQDLAKGVETLFRQSEPNSFTSLNGVVQQLEARLGLNLSHKTGFIRDHINFLLGAHPQPQSDHFALLNHHNNSQFPTSSYPQQFSPHFNVNFQHSHPADTQTFASQPSAQSRQLPPRPRLQPANTISFSQNASTVTTAIPKERFELYLFLFFINLNFWLLSWKMLFSAILFCNLLFLSKYCLLVLLVFYLFIFFAFLNEK